MSPRKASGISRANVPKCCLVVHDDLQVRLKIADLVRQTALDVNIHSLSRAGLDALATDIKKTYVAILLLIELGPQPHGADPLAICAQLRKTVPDMVLFVFASGGDERSAARAIKLGASEYWPSHSVNLEDLTVALKPLVEAPAKTNVVAMRSPAIDRYARKLADYRLLRTIAQSAVSTVYLAVGDGNEKPVALKVQAIKGDRSVTEADRERFTEEYRTLTILNNRAIADVLDFGLTDDYLYLAMEYFPCGSLRERLKHPLTEAEAFDYCGQIARALRVLHAAGVVHRDLKPSNIMLREDNSVVLIDFGSARSGLMGNETTRAGYRTGTPYYTCPESIEGLRIDQRADLYSLGVMYFEMLTRRLPFAGGTLSEIFDGHRLAEVPRLPAPFARHQGVIDRLLAKAVAHRYPSADALLVDLAALGALRDSGLIPAAQSSVRP